MRRTNAQLHETDSILVLFNKLHRFLLLFQYIEFLYYLYYGFEPNDRLRLTENLLLQLTFNYLFC